MSDNGCSLVTQAQQGTSPNNTVPSDPTLSFVAFPTNHLPSFRLLSLPSSTKLPLFTLPLPFVCSPPVPLNPSEHSFSLALPFSPECAAFG